MYLYSYALIQEYIFETSFAKNFTVASEISTLRTPSWESDFGDFVTTLQIFWIALDREFAIERGGVVI